MLISDLLSRTGRHKRSKRIGRGIGSGRGKTAGRGTKGMGAHSSDRPHRMSEGGQMPLVRRIPKRGFSNAQFRTEYQVVNVGTLEERFQAGDRVTAKALADLGLIHDAERPVKVLGMGELSKKLEVEVTALSASATDKIARAGGQAHPLVPKVEKKRPVAARPTGKQQAQGAGQEESGKKEKKKEKPAKKENEPVVKAEQGGKKEKGKKEPADKKEPDGEGQ
jgi:large subunit ribosomal protein L15